MDQMKTIATHLDILPSYLEGEIEDEKTGPLIAGAERAGKRRCDDRWLLLRR